MTGIEIGYAVAGVIAGAAGMYAYKCDCEKKLFSKMHGSSSQISRLRGYLESGHVVNQKIAKDRLDIKSLSTLLHRLRAEGMEIETVAIKGKKAADYKIKR
jgi:ethanolamine utilization cobalamin adenosyltransferase